MTFQCGDAVSVTLSSDECISSTLSDRFTICTKKKTNNVQSFFIVRMITQELAACRNVEHSTVKRLTVVKSDVRVTNSSKNLKKKCLHSLS